MKNLIKDTLEEIQKRHIKPEPKWKYLAKKYSLWFIFGLVVVFSAVAISAGYSNVNNLDWDLYRFVHRSRLAYYFSIVPYFWLVLAVIFLVAAFFEIRRTESGYRYGWLAISGLIIGGTLIFAMFFGYFNFGGKFNSAVAENFPRYSRHMMMTKETQWMQPEKGLLAGTIVSVSGDKLEIVDFDGEDWNILTDESTLIRPAVEISKNENIKIIGEKQDTENFKAQEIRPWNGMGKMNMSGHRQNRMRGN